MKRIFSRRTKKVMIIAATLAASFGIMGAVAAWSPDRPTYTVAHPADHVTFNSITDNPNYGDERTFFDSKDAANTSQGGFVDKSNVKDGEEVLLRVYVHNNAADNLNGTNYNGPGVAKNTKVRIFLPTATATALRANAYVSADNAQPGEVADTVDFAGTTGFNLSYVPGSAVSYTNAVPGGMKLSDSIVTTGAPIGYNQPNGVVPGCFQYTSIVTIKVKVSVPKYSIQKSVRFEGQTSADWKKSVTAKPGQTVEWRLAFTNNGSVPLKQVKVVDQVPAGLTVVPGSVKLYNGNYPSGYTYPDSAIQANGSQVNVNIGDYNPGINAFVLFKTQTPGTDKVACGTKQFTNVGYATPEGYGSVNDTAEVDVTNNENCKPPVSPSYDCKMITVDKLGDRKIRVTVNTVAINGAKVKNYVYDFGDGSTPLVSDKNPVEYTYAKDGNFIVRVAVNFDVNGTTKTVKSDVCAQTISFSTPVTPTTPTTSALPNTGPGDVLGIFAATTIAGAIGYRLFLARRLARG